MTIFFTSDTHFDHQNIIRLCNRPFETVEEMNETMVENWNKTVGKDDTVYHIGDFSWGGVTAAKAIFDRLNGQKHLIMGNHDEIKYMGKLDWVRIMDYHELPIHSALFNNRIILFHYPIVEWNGYYRGAIHVHGHQHNIKAHQAINRVDVGVDANNFTPISIYDLVKMCQWDRPVQQKNESLLRLNYAELKDHKDTQGE